MMTQDFFRSVRLLLLVWFTSVFVGCAPEPGGEQTESGKTGFRVVCTTGMVADLVAAVGGERVQVEALLGAGVDPHLYKATRDDVARMMRADMVFYSGLMLEGKMTDTLIKVSRNKPVFAVTEFLDESLVLEPEGFEGHADPHVWMDPQTWSACVAPVARALSEAMPAFSDEFETRSAAYVAEIDKLHDYGMKVLATVPEKSRVLISSHDAFHYFGRGYQFEVLGVQGISTESEAGLQRINELVDLIVDRNVAAVFVETSVSQKNIEALMSGAKARGQAVTIGGTLFSDAMGPQGTYEGTYIGMLDHNLTVIARGLGGDAPERGMQGKLSSEKQKSE